MKSHTINILKLCRHSGIANPSITHSITLIKKELNPIQDWGGVGVGGQKATPTLPVFPL